MPTGHHIERHLAQNGWAVTAGNQRERTWTSPGDTPQTVTVPLDPTEPAYQERTERLCADLGIELQDT